MLGRWRGSASGSILKAPESFGPGKARLLELIDEHGSIRSAAAAMNMSYRHAWLLLQAVEDTFGAPVISTATGGAKGGGAKLTELGRSLVAKYRAIENQAAKATAGDLSELTRTTTGSGGRARQQAARPHAALISPNFEITTLDYFPTITSDALMIAVTSSPALSLRSSTASLVIDAVTIVPLAISMRT